MGDGDGVGALNSRMKTKRSETAKIFWIALGYFFRSCALTLWFYDCPDSLSLLDQIEGLQESDPITHWKLSDHPFESRMNVLIKGKALKRNFKIYVPKECRVHEN